jgi:hypothetical protein
MPTPTVILLLISLGAFLLGLGHLISGRPGQVMVVSGTVLEGVALVFVLVGVTANG